MSKIIKTFGLILILIFVLCSCEDKDTITEYEILYVKYLCVEDGVFNKSVDEDFLITYVDKNGKFETVYVDSDSVYEFTIGNENKIMSINEGRYDYHVKYMLTQDIYNKAISIAPKVLEVKGGAE